MKQGDHDNTLVRDRSQEIALLHFPSLLPPHSQVMVSDHPPGENGFFKCVALFSLWQEECEFRQDYRDKRIFPPLSAPSPCIKEGFHINQTGKTRLLFEDKLFPNFQEMWFQQLACIHIFSLPFSPSLPSLLLQSLPMLKLLPDPNIFLVFSDCQISYTLPNIYLV